MKAQHKLAGFASALAISLFAASAAAEPTSMQNVMAVAIDSNPQIHQAEMNKQAIEFELEQAKGLYLPRITLEMSAGVRRLENSTRRAWNARETQTAVFRDLVDQSKSTDELLLSYREQFSVGRRSLLDVLDAQNTRFNVQVRAETARFSEMFAVYQVLASTNNLLDAFDLTAPESRRVYAREEVGYGPPAPAELQRRRYPQ